MSSQLQCMMGYNAWVSVYRLYTRFRGALWDTLSAFVVDIFYSLNIRTPLRNGMPPYVVHYVGCKGLVWDPGSHWSPLVPPGAASVTLIDLNDLQSLSFFSL